MQILDDIDNGFNVINRQGYEWFIHFLSNRYAPYYKYKSQHPKYHKPLFVWSVLWRLPLMIIPVLPALYVVSRVFGTILNLRAWFKNWSKPLAMTIALAVTAGLVSLPYRKFILRPNFADSAQVINNFFHLGVDAALQTPAAVGILVAGGLVLGAAVIYMAKEITRLINYKMTGSTSRKHLIDNSYDIKGNMILPESLMTIHRDLLNYHQELKKDFRSHPDRIRFNLDKSKKTDNDEGQGIGTPKPFLIRGASASSGTESMWVNDRQVDNPIEAAEEVIAQGKVLLNELEVAMKTQAGGEPVSPEQAELVVPTAGKTTQLYLWEAAINRIRPTPVNMSSTELEYDLVQAKFVEQKPVF